MATALRPRAVTGLGIVFGDEHKSMRDDLPRQPSEVFPTSNNKSPKPIQDNPTLRLYLHQLLESQAHQLRNRSISQATSTGLSSLATLMFPAAMASQNPQQGPKPRSKSVTETDLFKILYGDRRDLEHFRQFKEPLPESTVLANKSFMKFVAAKEPGFSINYQGIRDSTQKLLKEPDLVQSSPKVFKFFETLTNFHQTYLEAGARFLSYDLWLNMMKTYYTAENDTNMLSLFPVEPAALNAYLHEATIQTEPSLINARLRSWIQFHERWLHAERVLVAHKTSQECGKRLQQLERLNTIFNEDQSTKIPEARLRRKAQSRARREQRRRIRSVNEANVRSQYGREGMTEMPDTLMRQLHQDNIKDNEDFVLEQLPAKLKDIRIEEYPDSFVKMKQDAEMSNMHNSNTANSATSNTGR